MEVHSGYKKISTFLEISQWCRSGDGPLDPVFPVENVGVDAKGTILPAAELAVAIAGDTDENVAPRGRVFLMFVEFRVIGDGVPGAAWDEKTAATISAASVLVFTSGVQCHEMVGFCGLKSGWKRETGCEGCGYCHTDSHTCTVVGRK